jgi:glucan phosphorylase
MSNVLNINLFLISGENVSVFKFISQVNGVAELHSNILKQELFADYVSIWPNKFQNKTNGITPPPPSGRWLRFCNPELSEIVTKWLKTDEWTSNLDLLTELRKVCAHASSNLASIWYSSLQY